jgi:hypothetical protein
MNSCCTRTIQNVYGGLTPADIQHGRIANPLFVSSLRFTDQASLVDMALQISTTRIGWQRRIHVIQSILDTSSSSELMCWLVLLVIGSFTFFSTTSNGQCLEGFPLKWFYTTSRKKMPLAVRASFIDDWAMAYFVCDVLSKN